ncbi:MAG TPA: hypothetical protein VGE62_02030 [Candidatus Paceibacterota bacterium]
MKKKFYDIIPKEQRSIRNIPLPTSHRQSEQQQKHDMQPLKREASHEYEERVQEQAPRSHTVTHNAVSMDGVKKASSASRVRSRIQKAADEDGLEEAEERRMPAAAVRKYEPAFEYARASDLEDRAQEGSDEESDEESFESWNRNNKGGNWKTWTAVGLAGVAALFLLSIQFASATIRINPVKHEVAVNSSRMYLNEVAHRTVDVSAEASITVQAKGTAKVDRRASGTVVLYNAFNSAEQKLVANTRLETPEGLIFFLENPVTIPGQKTINGKATPGSVEAKVVASQSGEKYNVGLKDFKLVAYRGSDRYDKIYGRTKTSIGNGYVGEVPNVATGEVASTTRQLRDTLMEKLKAEALKAADSAKGEVFVDEAIVAVFETTKQEISKDGTTLTLSQKATAKAVLFDKSAVSAFLIKSRDQEEATSTDIVYTGNLDKLFVKFPTDTTPEDLSKENVYVMTSGTSTITSSIDTGRISKAVSGLTREQAIPAIKKLVELESIEVSIRPWWKSSLPAASKRVYVEIEE